MAIPSGDAVPTRIRLESPSRVALGAVVGVSFLLRLALVLTTAGDPIFDIPMLDAEYAVDWARSMQGGSWWGSPEGTVYFRTPLYSWFLAALFSLPGHDLLVARLAQALLGALAAGALAHVAFRRFGRVAFWTTGALAGLSWPLLYFGRELLIVSLVFFLGSMLLLLLDGARPASRTLRWFGIGALIGLGALGRANFLLVAVPVLAIAWRLAPERRWLRLAAVAAGLALCIAPITIRNRVVSGNWVLLSSQGGINLWIGNHPTADGMTAALPGFSSWRNDDVSAALAREYGRPVGAVEQDAHFRRLASHYVTSEPLSALRGLLRKTYFFVQGYEIRNNTDLYVIRERNGLLALPLPDFGWVFPLALVGIVGTWRRRGELSHLWGYGLAMAASAVLFFVCARYRLPAWPAFLIYAGAGVGVLADGSTSAARRGALAAVGVAALVLTHVDFLGIRSPDASQPHYQFGNAYARAGRYDEAEQEFRRALAITPANAEARHHLGALLLREGRVPAAVVELRAAANALPVSFRVRRSLAEALEASGQSAEAVAVRREAARLSAGDPEDRVALAITLGMNGDYDESLALFRAIEQDGQANGGFFFLNAGQTALALKKEALGQRWLEAARAYEPTRSAAYLAWARFQLSLGRWEPALQVLSEGLLKAPGDAEFLRLRAFARYHSDDETGAIEDLRAVLAIDPSDEATRGRLEQILSGEDAR